MRYSPDQIWLNILSELGDTIREDVYLRQAKPMALTESELIVSVPSVYTQEQIASRFLPDINGLLKKQIGASCRLKIIAAQPDGKRHPEPSALIYPCCCT